MPRQRTTEEERLVASIAFANAQRTAGGEAIPRLLVPQRAAEGIHGRLAQIAAIPVHGRNAEEGQREGERQ